MPHTVIVIMNWRSTLGPCSEIACGNHQCLLTNMPTEPSVMIQMAIPRAGPIDYLLLKKAKSEGPGAEHGPALCSLHLALTCSRPSLRTTTASRARKPAGADARADSISKAP